MMHGGSGADLAELPSLLLPPAACLVGPKLGKNKETMKKIGRPCSFPGLLAEKIKKQTGSIWTATWASVSPL